MGYSSRDPSYRSRSRRREAILDQVRERCGRFGKDVVSTVSDFALHPSRMGVLLGRLGMQPRDDLDGQLDCLCYYIAQIGESKFVMRARHEIWLELERADREDDQGLASPPAVLEVLQIGLQKSVPPALVRGSDLRPATPEPKAETPTGGPPAAEVAEVPPTEPAVEELPPPADLLEAVEARPWVETAGYVGPERRLGPANRRSGQNRRQSLVSVAKNRRFGRDRRAGKPGRRTGDRDPKA